MKQQSGFKEFSYKWCKKTLKGDTKNNLHVAVFGQSNQTHGTIRNHSVDKMLVRMMAFTESLKITVGHRTMSDQNHKLSDQTKNTPDILSDGINSRQN